MRRHSLAINTKTDRREDLMQVLRIEMMKIEKIRRALKIKEHKEVTTLMIDDPRVTEIIMSSVSSVGKLATLHEIVDSSGEQLKQIRHSAT